MSHVLARLLFITCWCAQHFGAHAVRTRSFLHCRACAPSQIETRSAHAIHHARSCGTLFTALTWDVCIGRVTVLLLLPPPPLLLLLLFRYYCLGHCFCGTSLVLMLLFIPLGFTPRPMVESSRHARAPPTDLSRAGSASRAPIDSRRPRARGRTSSTMTRRGHRRTRRQQTRHLRDH